MHSSRTNITVQARGCFRHTNTMFPAVLHAPSKESQSSTLVITDPLNQKMEHCTIKWENLSFLTDWVIDTPRAPIPRSITSAQIKKHQTLQLFLFPKETFLDPLLVQNLLLHSLLHLFVYMPLCNP